MNERIKELLASPGLERLNDWVSIGPVQRAALEEFAELIIKGCCNAVGERNYYVYGGDIGNMILRHFGMEP